MKINKKLTIIVITIIFILVITPLLFIKLAQPHDFMGTMILLFFIINPVLAIFVNSMVGKDVNKLWSLPLIFSIVFLVSYWFILKEIILDLVVYALIYLIIGIIVMFISFFVSKKKQK